MSNMLDLTKARKWELTISACVLGLGTLIFLQAPDNPTLSDWVLLLLFAVGIGIATGIAKSIKQWLKNDAEPKWQLKKMTIFICLAAGVCGVISGWIGWNQSDAAANHLEGWDSTLGTITSVNDRIESIGLASVHRYFCSIYYEVKQKSYKQNFTLTQRPDSRKVIIYYDANNPEKARPEMSLRETKSNKSLSISILTFGIVAIILGSIWLIARIKSE